VSTLTRPTGEQQVSALRWVATRGVEVVVEPSPGGAMRTGAVTHPTLHLLAHGAPAPERWGELEDWVRLPGDAGEICDRAERLVVRAARLGAPWTFVDDDDVLRVGAALVPLSPIEARLVRMLLERAGAVVSRGEVEAALWPRGVPADVRALDNRLARLRRRLGGTAIEIHTVRGRGLLLERVARTVPHPGATFS
jgi:hypothetical protein